MIAVAESVTVAVFVCRLNVSKLRTRTNFKRVNSPQVPPVGLGRRRSSDGPPANERATRNRLADAERTRLSRRLRD